MVFSLVFDNKIIGDFFFFGDPGSGMNSKMRLETKTHQVRIIRD